MSAWKWFCFQYIFRWMHKTVLDLRTEDMDVYWKINFFLINGSSPCVLNISTNQKVIRKQGTYSIFFRFYRIILSLLWEENRELYCKMKVTTEIWSVFLYFKCTKGKKTPKYTSIGLCLTHKCQDLSTGFAEMFTTMKVFRFVVLS